MQNQPKQEASICSPISDRDCFSTLQDMERLFLPARQQILDEMTQRIGEADNHIEPKSHQKKPY